MKDKVVLVNEKQAEKARKMIEAKGMKVDEDVFKIDGDYKYLQFDRREKNWFISLKLERETEIPWKEFKSMFRMKKKNPEINQTPS